MPRRVAESPLTTGVYTVISFSGHDARAILRLGQGGARKEYLYSFSIFVIRNMLACSFTKQIVAPIVRPGYWVP